MLQLKYRNGSFSCFVVFIEIISLVFFFQEKKEEWKGWEVALDHWLPLALTTPKPDRYSHHSNCSFQLKGELVTVDTNRTHTCLVHAQAHMAPITKNLIRWMITLWRLEPYLGLCAFKVMGSASLKQPSPEGQETFINCSLQQSWQNSRQDDMHQSQRTRRLIWQPPWLGADMGHLTFEGKFFQSESGCFRGCTGRPKKITVQSRTSVSRSRFSMFWVPWKHGNRNCFFPPFFFI